MGAPCATLLSLALLAGARALSLQGGDMLVRGGDVDAWLYDREKTMAQDQAAPIIASVEEGLRAAGATTQLFVQEDAAFMHEGIKAAVQAGRQPLLFAVGVHLDHRVWPMLRQGADLGARLVLYQTEWEKGAVEFMASLASRMNASEVWEYSHAHVKLYPKMQAVVRFVPPGYSRAWDVNVTVNSTSAVGGAIGFMGSLAARPKSTVALVVKQFNQRLHATSSVWTKESLRRYLEQYPVQLTLHRQQGVWPNEDIAMCTFRMAPLLSNKACVISAPASYEDMVDYSGMVHFAEVSDFGRKFHEVAADVVGCQQRAYTAFKKNFDPLRLIQKSGLLDVWQPAQLSSAAAR